MLKIKIYFLKILKKLNFKNYGVHLLYICQTFEVHKIHWIISVIIITKCYNFTVLIASIDQFDLVNFRKVHNIPWSADLPQHSVERSVASHHGAPELLETGQHLGLVLVPGELHVDQDAVHKDPRVTWHNLLEEHQILDKDLVLGR